MRRISFYSIALMLLLGSLTTSFQKASAQTQEKDVIFIIPEQMPSFPGGEAAAIEYLNNNARHPENTKKKKIQGHVFANFDVEKDGSIEDVHVLQSTAPLTCRGNHPSDKINDTMDTWQTKQTNCSCTAYSSRDIH